MELFTLDADYAASGGAVFPEVELLDRISFEKPYALVGLHLSSSGFNLNTVAPVGVYVLVDQTRPRLTLSNSIRSIGSHVSFGGQATGQSTWIGFGQHGLRIPPGSSLALYGFGQTAASPLTRVFAIAALQLISIR